MTFTFSSRLILDRVKEAYNLHTDAELAKFLDVLTTRVSNWVTRNTIDYNLIFSKCTDLNYDWLITGHGEKFRNNIYYLNIDGSFQNEFNIHNLNSTDDVNLEAILLEKEKKVNLLQSQIIGIQNKIIQNLKSNTDSKPNLLLDIGDE